MLMVTGRADASARAATARVDQLTQLVVTQATRAFPRSYRLSPGQLGEEL